MKYLIFFILILFSSITMALSCPTDLNKNSEINYTIKKNIDFDNDGVLDIIELHITAANFHSPFKWDLKIYSKNKLIFKRTHENKRIDHLFSDTNYVGDCTDYDDCKCSWYFQKFFARIMVKYDPKGLQDRLSEINNSLKKELKKEYSKNQSTTEKVIKKATKRIIDGKAILIRIYDEPEKPTSPMIWIPEFKRFVSLPAD